MGQEDRQVGDLGAAGDRAAEQILKTVTQDLQNLQQGVVNQLAQDVSRLQAEKARLIQEVTRLQAGYQALQARQTEALSQQQIAQQQLWARQMAQVMANYLHKVLEQRLEQLMAQSPSLNGKGEPPALGQSASLGQANQLLNTLDASFTNTFKALQQELNSYQSSLSQQLSRMQTLEQQGEALLAALVNRLREQLPQDLGHSELQVPRNSVDIRPPRWESQPPRSISSPLPEGVVPPPVGNEPTRTPPLPGTPPTGSGVSPRVYQDRPPQATPIPLEFPAAPLPLQPKPKPPVHIQLGFWLVLLSTVALSVHNVVVRMIGNKDFVTKALEPAQLFGFLPWGGFIELNVGNSLLILWLRMIVVLLVMVLASPRLYPPVWRDIKVVLWPVIAWVMQRLGNRTLRPPMGVDRRPLINVIISGLCLFLSQVFIYIAIGQIGPGVAVTILFMYPLVTVPLSWFLFKDKPSPLRWVVMGVIALGVICTSWPTSATRAVSGQGVTWAIASGIAFAFYLIFMQLGFRKLHPVPVSLIQFFTIFFLTSISLMLPVSLGVHVDADKLGGFLVGGIILGGLTLVGYLANNFGVRFMGAARASILASIGPVMTAVLAWLLIQNPIQSIQAVGILLVTGGVTALSFERMRGQATPPPQPAKETS